MPKNDDRRDDILADVRALRPTHALPAEEREQLGVGARRGRPRKIQPASEPDDYALALDNLRQGCVEADPLVSGGGDQILAAMLELAREAAALHHERRRLEGLGRDAASVSSRRIDALVRIGAIEVARRRHGPGEIDVRSEKFQQIVTYFHALLEQCVRETLQREDAERFLARYAERSQDWEEQIDPVPQHQPDRK